MAGTGQGVDHDAHAVLAPVVEGVIVERLQHFALQTNAAPRSVAVRRSARATNLVYLQFGIRLMYIVANVQESAKKVIPGLREIGSRDQQESGGRDSRNLGNIL